MRLTYLTIIPEVTKTKGIHMKLLYSLNREVKRFSTNIFVSDLNKTQINHIKNGQLRNNWFKQGDYNKLLDLAINYDSEVQKYVDESGRKPSPKVLDEMVNGDKKKRLKETSTELCEILQDYILEKEEKLLKKYSSRPNVRKKLERYKTIQKVLNYYSTNYLNEIITIGDIIKESFWEKLFQYLLFYKPRSEKHYNKKQKHKLSDLDGESKFDSNFGISNNTLLKWLGDLNTMFNSCKSNSLLISSIDKIKESQKTAIDSLQIHEFENINASLRKKEFDYLKSSEFESSIHDDLLNDKKISKENLIKVKDMFIAMIIVGCRYEDFQKFSIKDIINKSQTASKTQNKYLANINDTFIKIFKRYDYNLKMSNQQFNQRIKVLMRQFYLTDNKKIELSENDLLFVEESIRGRFTQHTFYKKWEMIGAHTARRSFACIAYYDGKIPKQVIMEFTGHKSEREFDKYIGLKVDEKTSKKLANLFN